MTGLGWPTYVPVKGSPRAHFGLFDLSPENQDKMIQRADLHAPRSLMTPGLDLQSINSHRRYDGRRVVNLCTWSTFEFVDTLTQKPGFQKNNKYREGVPDFRYDFLDVPAIIAAA